ncbi:MAG: hypothetical protein H0U89_10760 [Acidimicrobiia bacterium]|nr:hypothetical protein [Acidimicrobiia bacterium]
MTSPIDDQHEFAEVLFTTDEARRELRELLGPPRYPGERVHDAMLRLPPEQEAWAYRLTLVADLTGADAVPALEVER